MVLNLAIVVAIQREDVRQSHAFQRLLTICYIQQSVDEQGLHLVPTKVLENDHLEIG
jgi:hypothetical protein